MAAAGSSPKLKAVFAACAQAADTHAAPAQKTTTQKTGRYADVAPLLARRCAGCHNPHGGAPFSLLTYEDAKQWGEQMLEVTQSRYMPPWLPALGFGSFVGERRLSDGELATIRNWVSSGMPPAPAQESAVAASTASKPEWAHGKPDLVLDLVQPIELPGSGSDRFLNLLVPYTGDRHIVGAVELRASDPQAIRSIRLQVDRAGVLRRQHPDDGGIPGLELPVATERELDAGGNLLFWTPDAPVLESERTPWALERGSDLVLTTHLKTTGRSEQIKVQVGLYYDKSAVGAKSAAAHAKPLVLRLAHAGETQIPADQAKFTLDDALTLPEPVSVTAIYPQAHFLGRQLDAWAILPGGKKVWLISIPKWDVDWQAVYRYTHPVALPKGTVVHWQYTYDNSAGNPHNPNDPPKLVAGGDGMDQEVDRLVLQVSPPAGQAESAGWRSRLLAAAAR
jgi:mono/diheme cytochrome c family protein